MKNRKKDSHRSIWVRFAALMMVFMLCMTGSSTLSYADTGSTNESEVVGVVSDSVNAVSDEVSTKGNTDTKANTQTDNGYTEENAGTNAGGSTDADSTDHAVDVNTGAADGDSTGGNEDSAVTAGDSTSENTEVTADDSTSESSGAVADDSTGVNSAVNANDSAKKSTESLSADSEDESDDGDAAAEDELDAVSAADAGLTTFIWEDDEKVVTVCLSDPDALPEGAEFVVEDLTQEEYDECRNLIIEQQFANNSDYGETEEERIAYAEAALQNLILYDMHFVYEGEEIEPDRNTMSVMIEFKTAVSLTTDEIVETDDYIFVPHEDAEEETVVFHVEETAEGEETENVTDNVMTDDEGAVEEVDFTVDSFSVIGTVTIGGYITVKITNDTLIKDYGGSYTLYYTLNNYNIFSSGDVTAYHTVGAVAVGGEAAFPSSIGSSNYIMTVPSYFAGDITAFGDYQDTGKYGMYLTRYDDTLQTYLYERVKFNYGTDSPFIDFDAAMTAIEKDMSGYVTSSNNIHVDKDNTKATLKEDHYTVEDDGTTVTVTLQSGYSYEFTDLDAIDYINIVTDTVHNENVNIISEEDGKIVLPKVLINGEYPSGSESDYGCSLVFMLPKAGTVDIGSKSNGIFLGHVVAPCAAVVSDIGGNTNGSFICASFNVPSMENHMWHYTGSIITSASQGFKASKTLDGAAPTEADDEFSFTLSELQLNKNNKAEWKVLQTKTSDYDTGLVTFDAISYSAEGTHWYMISEVQGNTTKYTFDNTVYLVEVVVTIAAEPDDDGTDDTDDSESSEKTDTTETGSITTTYTSKATYYKLAADIDVLELVEIWSETTTENGEEVTSYTVTIDKSDSEKLIELKLEDEETVETESVDATETDETTETDDSKVSDTSKIFTFANSTIKEGFTASKTLDGAAPTEADDEFSFTLSELQLDENNKADWKVLQTKISDYGTGLVTFDHISYSTEGTHWYMISEVQGDTTKYIFDTTVYLVEVVVTIAAEPDDDGTDDTEDPEDTEDSEKTDTTETGSTTISYTSTATYYKLAADIDISKLIEIRSETTTENGEEVTSYTATIDKSDSKKLIELKLEDEETSEAESVESTETDETTETDDSKVFDTSKIFTFANSTIKEGFTASKTLDGAVPTEADDEFLFTLSELQLDENNKADWKVLQTKTSDCDTGLVMFDDIFYSAEGTHWYMISEVQGDTTKYTFDTTVYLVEVVVTLKTGTTDTGITTATYTSTDTYYKLAADIDVSELVEIQSETTTENEAEVTSYTATIDKSDSEKLIELKLEDEEAVETEPVDATETDESKETDDSEVPDTSKIFTFANSTIKGSLWIKKNVTINDKATTSDDADGTYTFYVLDESGNEVARQNITIENGKSQTKEIKNLKPGTYYVYEDTDGLSSRSIFLITDNGIKVTVTADNTTEISTASFTNNLKEEEYTASGDLVLEVSKQLDTDEPTRSLSEGQFKFTVTQVDENGKPVDGYTETESNDENGIVTFEKIGAYTQDDIGKTYYYTITEVNDDQSGYTYDETVYVAKVIVSDAGNGILSTDITYYEAEDAAESYNESDLTDVVEQAVFHNSYATEGSVAFTATKIVEGRTLMDQQFTFGITQVDASGEPVANGYSNTATNDANGSITFPAIDYSQSGTYYYQIAEVNDQQKDYAYDARVYTAKVVVSDTGEGQLTTDISYTYTDTGSNAVEAESVVFENTFEGVIADFSFIKVNDQDPMQGIEGSEYGLYDEEGELVTTVVSDESGLVTFGDLDVNVPYTIKELDPPAGSYVSPEEIIFVIAYDETTKVMTVEITDDGDGTLVTDEDGNYIWLEAQTIVSALKTDEDGNPLAGAVLQIQDEDGNPVVIGTDESGEEITSWVTTSEEKRITSILDTGKVYYLVELEAPDGYEIADPIEFMLEDKAVAHDAEQVVELVMVDEKSTTTTTTTEKTTKKTTTTTAKKTAKASTSKTKTGDATPVMPYVIMILAALAVAVGVIVRRRRIMKNK